ncbi:unnamed protein product [Orchesella dallaii]|uniref:Gustatory receptor n=1 Tax=Orchesella dallaii TaxID=48710 RepID=A0ABP1S5F8_9HEXA
MAVAQYNQDFHKKTQLESLFQKDFEYIINQTRSNKFPNKFATSFPGFRQTKDYQVAKVFCPLIKLVRLVGCCSVTITKTNPEITYSVKWISFPFVFTAVGICVNGFILVTWILNSFLGISYPVRLFRNTANSSNWISENLMKGSELIGIINTIIKASLPAGAWILTFAHLKGIHYLCDFLNEWTTFFQKFEETFTIYYRINFNLARRRNIFSIIWLAPVGAFFFGMKAGDVMSEHIPKIINLLFSHWISLCIIGIRSICYLKDFLLLQTLQMAYQEVLNGMKAEYTICKTSISKGQVHAWLKLLLFLRLQSSRVENYIGLQNLWSIFEVFVSVLLNFSMETELAETIIQMQTSDDDCEARLEMKLICDLIYKDPIKIRIASVLTLNTSLLLAVRKKLTIVHF